MVAGATASFFPPSESSRSVSAAANDDLVVTTNETAKESPKMRRPLVLFSFKSHRQRIKTHAMHARANKSRKESLRKSLTCSIFRCCVCARRLFCVLSFPRFSFLRNTFNTACDLSFRTTHPNFLLATNSSSSSAIATSCCKTVSLLSSKERPVAQDAETSEGRNSFLAFSPSFAVDCVSAGFASTITVSVPSTFLMMTDFGFLAAD